MGTALSPLIESKEIKQSDLAGKKLAVDSFNMLYQFLTTIRQQDGRPLTDSSGRVTSHLSGLFFRTTSFMRTGMKLAFVFDGVAPDLKRAERERRKDIKEEAQRKYDLAVEAQDIELMKKYASRTTSLTKESIDESKELITALGLPIVQAPSEGEAQAAYMVNKGDFYASVSQDTDSLIFGASRMVKNMSISGRKKTKSAFKTIEPEIISLADNLNRLGLDREQLIIIAMLCGTDFNIGGIKGVGPKKALDLIRKHKKDFRSLFDEVNWNASFSYPWEAVYDTIKNIPILDNYVIEWKPIDRTAIIDIMVTRHNFSEERILTTVDELIKKTSQRGLGDFF